MAAEQGLQVDEAGFRRLMGEQRDRAKADARAKKSGHGDTQVYRQVADAVGGQVEFTGYDQTVTDATVRDHPRRRGRRARRCGEEIEIVLDRTPLYAESGGQLADHGFIRLSNGALLEVSDVQRPITGLVVHRARVLEGEVATGEGAEAVVDVARRRSISRAHTATHMVHQALRDELGRRPRRPVGELARPTWLDFGKDHVPAAAMAEIEARINVLLDDLPVTADVMALDAARRMGAMALFGEKYGERVRVVPIGDWSRELCVGTHTPCVGQIGVVKLLGEASIGSGVRRVEALVGADAYGHLAREAAIVSQLTETLNVRRDELPWTASRACSTKLKDAEREIAAVKQGQVLGAAPGLVASARDLGGVTFVSHDAGSDVRAEDLRASCLDVQPPRRRPTGRRVHGGGGRRSTVRHRRDQRAGAWRGHQGRRLRPRRGSGLGGGGKDDIAQGGGSDPSKVSTRSARSRTSFAPGAHEPGRRTSHPRGQARSAGRRRRGQRPRRRRRLRSLGVLAHPVRTLGRTPRPTPTCTRSSPSPRRSEPSRSSSAQLDTREEGEARIARSYAVRLAELMPAVSVRLGRRALDHGRGASQDYATAACPAGDNGPSSIRLRPSSSCSPPSTPRRRRAGRRGDGRPPPQAPEEGTTPMKEHLESSIFGDQDDPHGTARGATREPAPTDPAGAARRAGRPQAREPWPRSPASAEQALAPEAARGHPARARRRRRRRGGRLHVPAPRHRVLPRVQRLPGTRAPAEVRHGRAGRRRIGHRPDARRGGRRLSSKAFIEAARNDPKSAPGSSPASTRCASR